MLNIKVFQLLSTLNKKEFSNFQRFIASPFFNANQKVIDFVKELKVFHPAYEIDETKEKWLYAKLFKTKKFNKQNFRYLMTDLTKLLEAFLAQVEFQEQALNKKLYLSKQLQQRQAPKQAAQVLHSIQQMLKKTKLQDVNYFHHLVEFDEQEYLFRQNTGNRALDKQLQKLVDDIDVQYLGKKLKYACEIINRQNIFSIKYELPFLENTIDFLKKNNYAKVPAVTIYLEILLMLQEKENEKHYRQLKKLLKENIEHFPSSELYDMFTFAQNFCIKKINEGNTDYLQELFENYKILLAQKIILEKGFISQFDFKNIVTIGLRLKEYFWVKNFIQEYQEQLHPEFKINAVNYNLANLHFTQREFRKALRLLLSVEFTDVYYHLDAKALILKSYYESDEVEPMLSLINTFKVYTKRNKLISEYQRSTYNNFLFFVKKLAKAKLGSKKPLAEIRKEMEAAKNIADATWLFEKLRELEL